MIRSCLQACLGLLVFAAAAQAQTTFEVKYPEGTKHTRQHDSKSTQTLTLAGMDIDTKSSTLIRMETSIGKRAADGTLQLQTKPESLQSEISLPGGLSIQFDSVNPNVKAPIPQLEPLLDVLRAASRLTVTVELDAKNKVVSVKLPEGEFEKLPDAAKERFAEETMKKELEHEHDALPSEPVKVGEKWERSRDANIGGGQTMSFRTTYEYAGPVEKDGVKLEKITGKTFDVNYRLEGNPALQVPKSELKVVQSSITILFDPAQGSIVSSSSLIQVAGPLTLVVNNMELDGKVDLTIEESTSRQK